MNEFKTWNTYETQDHKQKTKELLRDEINNIALRIAKARHAKS